jgi:hypothetical protein
MEGVTGHNLVLRCRGVKDDRRQVDLSRRAAEIRISPHGEAHRPRLMVDATQLLDMGTRRRQRCASPHLRPGAALPMRRRVPARGRSGDARAPHVVVFPATSHLRSSCPSGRRARVRVRALRPSTGVSHVRRRFYRPRSLPEESPLRLRIVRTSCVGGGLARRFRRIRVPLRPQFPEARRWGAQDPASPDMFL